MSFKGYKESFGTQQITNQLKDEHEHEIKLHSHPLLPNNVDEFGNLPRLQCGWKACGKKFESREQLLDHVKYCMPHKFIDRFHTNCKNVLERDPSLTLAEFMHKVRDFYPAEKAELIMDDDLVAYYNQFDVTFKQHEHQKDVQHLPAVNKELAEILFDFRIQSMKKFMAEHTIPEQFVY
mmetsp:Transcript_56460/g.93997  ORF Transcript_56460/g.93997 Transcript_56460/m.93997 type:complete len:179 (-) Transcript_56460:178-714(-)|eukprot:CAMPEP_0202689656 /NCGR_PEP_ID=MMETSP1385-20130828/4861_1 /ASSEMBLY_ACC=CAM_ASM_000861 /TAXON_ID=933848 /ORGANISM="Elphidium margaritaceum" /LENGTH=178 /DNA_ID=CAMNT_0049344811 /DNA_START=47 /DNA_END=583 /DNA_ORIENTATION=+